MQKHRILTNVGKDNKITVELKQDYELLEILSLKFSQKDAYASFCSDYGVVCGRISVNNGLGIPNARVSIFVPLKDEHENDPVISALYPYKEADDKNEAGYKYNLLPSRQQHPGHQPTGTFFDQTDILTREEVLEVFETYYSYTVKTNEAGDFMIWGVPLGNQTLHVDVDLSDIGCFSLRPYDFIRQGAGVDKFKNKYQFKSSEDLVTLPQIISYNKSIEVYPFWGNEEYCEIGITRTDFDLAERGINIQPKAYVIGGVYTDNGKNAINKNCVPKAKMGRKCDLVAKSAKVELIRFTSTKDDNNRPILEQVILNEDIPDDGGFVIPLEMNMDYVFTNEFGENEITNDPNKGVATSACYRMRININDNDLSRVRMNADYLIPNIREYVGQVDKSYAWSLNWSDYPTEAVSANSTLGILYNENGEYYPKDYFYRFNYNKVYTVSSFQSSYHNDILFTKDRFIGIKDIVPAEEEDCAENNTPPVNFGLQNYTFTLLIADFLLLLDYIIKFLYLGFLNFLIKDVLNPIAEILVDVGGGRGARHAVTRLQISTFTKLSLVNYPECEECDSEFNQSSNQTIPAASYCSVGELSIVGANGVGDKTVNVETYFPTPSCTTLHPIIDRADFITNQTNYILYNPVMGTYTTLDGSSFFKEVSGDLVFVDGYGSFTTSGVTYSGIEIYDKDSINTTPPAQPETGCELYDTIYDDSLITGYYVPPNTPGASNPTYYSRDNTRKWLGTLPPGVNPISTSIATQFVNRATDPPYSNSGTVSRDLENEYWWEAVAAGLPTSLRSEFKNGIFYLVLGTQSSGRLTGLLKEYYRRKRIGSLFCGGIVNYAYIDNWLSGSLYFFQFKAKKVSDGVESAAKYCRDVVRFVQSQGRFYYRSTMYNNGVYGQTISGSHKRLGKSTTFVDLGPRDEFIKEICTDTNLDVNSSVARSIGATTYKDFGEMMGLIINYRMDTSGATFKVDDFFTNSGYTSIGFPSAMDGDILQLVSMNCEAGIEGFDLQSPKYLGYSYEYLDPEVYPQVFKKNGYWGPTPITLDFSEDGDRVRSSLNEPTHLNYTGGTVQGRLTESSQIVPFYLWDKKGTGFGGTSNATSDDQSWDYANVMSSQPLQGMTYGYAHNGQYDDDSDKYLLLPITYDFNGLSITGNVTNQIEFDAVITGKTGGTTIAVNLLLQDYNNQYPGFTVLAVLTGSLTTPLTGTLYTRRGAAGNNGSTGWATQSWDYTVDFIIRPTSDYYYPNTKQILSTPFQFYFGLKQGKTGLDKFIDLFGPKGAFTEN
ncbi:MAG: hypothetical protein RLZ10_1275 [Bacteroidota bacterium]|jgi:hypothetical protein